MDKISSPIKSRILEFIDFKGFEKKAFFEKNNLSASNFRGTSLKSEVGGDVIAKISSSYPEINTDWLLTGNGPMIRGEVQNISIKPYSEGLVKTQSVPLYNIEASAGIVTLFSDTHQEKPIDFINIPNLPKVDGAVYVNGDSMYPLLKSGDIVMYKQIHNIIEGIFFGEMYLLSVDQDGDEMVLVKWIQKSDKGEKYIKLVSQNAHHQDKDIKLSSVRYLAIIKASIRINSMF